MNITTTWDRVIEADDFPWDYNYWHYSEDVLRRYLFSPSDPTLCEDDDHLLVMDYDGFVEWFPVWNNMYPPEDDEVEDWYKDNEGGKYLSEHVGRTVTVIKEVLD